MRNVSVELRFNTYHTLFLTADMGIVGGMFYGKNDGALWSQLYSLLYKRMVKCTTTTQNNTK